MLTKVCVPIKPRQKESVGSAEPALDDTLIRQPLEIVQTLNVGRLWCEGTVFLSFGDENRHHIFQMPMYRFGR